MPTIGHCRDCRWWRRVDATDNPRTALGLESGEHGRCLNDKVKLYDSNSYGGPFLPDGLYAETDWDGHALLTGQHFGCIHWTAIDTAAAAMLD